MDSEAEAHPVPLGEEDMSLPECWLRLNAPSLTPCLGPLKLSGGALISVQMLQTLECVFEKAVGRLRLHVFWVLTDPDMSDGALHMGLRPSQLEVAGYLPQKKLL